MIYDVIYIYLLFPDVFELGASVYAVELLPDGPDQFTQCY